MIESLPGHEEDLFGREAKAQEIIEEEIVKLIGTHKVFRLLLDIAFLVGRNQFGRDGRIDDVEENVP